MTRETAASTSPTAGRVVRPLPFASDADLVGGLRARDPEMMGAFYDRHASHVLRVLGRILGAREPELLDLQHEVFVRAFASIGTLAEPAAVRSWLTSIAVFTARICIQRRTRGRWLRFFAPEEMPRAAASDVDDEARAALRATYVLLDRMPTDERVAFALRFIDGLELTEVASACRVSLATIKRRLARAEAAFVGMARNEPTLQDWVEGGARWGVKEPQ